MARILSIGEVMLEMSDLGDALYKKSFAGDSFNMAYYMSAVSTGEIRIDYLTAVGCDDLSRDCLAFIENHGVSTGNCVQDSDRTIGMFILSNDEHGEKQYSYWRGQSAARHLFDKVRDLQNFDWVYLSGITAAVTKNTQNLITSLKASKAKIIYDFNHRSRLWGEEGAREFAQKLLPFATVVKISDEELDVLYPNETLQSLSGHYQKAEWVLTCGGSKAEVWSNGQQKAVAVFHAVEHVVDSSAAGDSFIAGYLVAKIRGLNADAGLKLGHSVASQVVCAKGSIVPIDMTKLEKT
ncbi:MAG: sugar kinase [Sneathiella sp.]